MSLAWGGGASDRQTVTITPTGTGFATHALRFRARGTTDNGRLEIVSRGTGSFTIGAVSLMPADNVLGWRADTLALLRELDSPVYRWPGGNFVSGYDWKDGVGDPDRRPPRKNPAWKGVEHNDVGLHEFMDLCRLIGTAPYVAVNTGKGGPESARELVEYANGAATTPFGRKRAENGSSRPFGVKLWAVGNEMYGDWQIGHMPLSKYVEKHKAVVDAMRTVDPGIEPIAVGAVGEWSQTMLRDASTHMAHLSEHLYWQSKPEVPAHVAQAVEGIRKVAEAHRAYRRDIPALKGKDIRIALDEWNYWYGPNEYGELGTRYFLQDGLGIAAGLHELFRNSDLYFMANYAQTVNVIGAIKTTPDRRGDGGDGPRPGPVPAPLRDAAGEGRGRARAARRGGGVDGRPLRPDRGRRQSHRGAAPAAARRLRGRGRGEGTTARPGGARPPLPQRPGRPRGVTVTETALGQGGDVLEAPPLSVVLHVLPVR